MPIHEHDRVKLHYEISGDGPPLLLIAGMMSDSASWAPLVPLLDPHYTVIRIDNRTTGRTVPWNAETSVEKSAFDCAALIDRLGIGRAHVMGHSLGGLIGLHLAKAYPGTVHSLTLAAAAPVRLERNVQLFKTLLAIRNSNAGPAAWLHALYPWLFAPALYETPGAIEQATAAALAYPYAQSAAAMAHQIAALEGYTPDALIDLDHPVQAILGTDDMLLPLALAHEALQNIPTHPVAGAGHSIHWDAPLAVADQLKRFTDNL